MLIPAAVKMGASMAFIGYAMMRVSHGMTPGNDNGVGSCSSALPGAGKECQPATGALGAQTDHCACKSNRVASWVRVLPGGSGFFTATRPRDSSGETAPGVPSRGGWRLNIILPREVTHSALIFSVRTHAPLSLFLSVGEGRRGDTPVWEPLPVSFLGI